MRSLVLFALFSVAAAKPKPGGLYGAPAYSSYSLPVAHEPVAIAQPLTYAQPVVHAAPAVIAKPAATSYASFHQQIVHPVAQPVVHAPVIAQPVVHAPVVQTVAQPVVQTVAQPIVHAAPVVQTYAQPLLQKYLSVGSLGHGW